MAVGMATQSPKPRATLTDLPPELWDHIVSYLPTASAIARFGRTCKSLHAYVEKNGWNTFSRTKFPSVCPINALQSQDTARTLTTLSRAWDRRGFVARFVVPQGDITAYPGGQKLAQWKKPKGQTIEFIPRLDVYEEIGPTWRDRNETFAFSAGAEVCIRQTKRYDSREDTKWTKYRPHSAREGRDDITTLHLLRPDRAREAEAPKVIIGTANGDLQLLQMPSDDAASREVNITYFATEGQAVQASNLWQEDGTEKLLASFLGKDSLAVFRVDPEQHKICPSSQIDTSYGEPLRGSRPRCGVNASAFLSSSKLAAGVGIPELPIYIYSITEAEISKAPLRKFALEETHHTPSEFAVFAVCALPPSTGSSGIGDVFLSGASDGIVRLHDLRSPRHVEQKYLDMVDMPSVYSILPRGQESFLIGANQHNLLKLYDLRLGGKQYHYHNATSSGAPPSFPTPDCSVFLRPANMNNWIQNGPRLDRRSVNSSVYSLASSSYHSPYIFAGLQGAVWSLAFTDLQDSYPDPVYFKSPIKSKEVQPLTMYEQVEPPKMYVQGDVVGQMRRGGRLDERWEMMVPEERN